MENEKECYGRMFPSVLELRHNEQVKGHLFAYTVECTGISTGDRSVSADLGNWQECTRCSKLDICYRLSVGQLLMELAVRHSGVLH